MRKSHFKKGLIPLLGIAVSLFATAANAQMTTVVLSGSITPGTRIMAKNEGDPVANGELKVTITGGYTPSSVYVWKKNGVVISGAANSPSFIIGSVTPTDAGTYSCTVTRANSSTDATTVTMDADSVCILQVSSANITQAPYKDPYFRSGARPPYVVYTPGTVTNIAQSNLGQTLGRITAVDTTGYGYLTPAVPGRKASSAKWFRNGVEINASTPGFVATDFGWTTNQGPYLQLTASNTQVATNPNGDQYAVQLINSVGSAMSGTFNVAIVGSSAVPTLSKINSQDPPASINTVVFDTMFIGSKSDFLNVVASNTISYQWYKGLPPNGTLISGAVSSLYTPANGWAQSDSGTYYVKLMNGTTATSPSTLSNPIQIAVVSGKGITVGVPTGNNTLAERDTLRLTAAANGVKLYQNAYKWYKNGELVSGQSGTTMTVLFTTITDTGSYTYKAFNEVDSSALSASVKVSITREPLPLFHNLKDVYDGITNVISPQMGLVVKGEGSENLTVWNVIDSKGTSIVPQTNTAANKTWYYLASSASGQTFPAGKYTLRVTNADGTLVLEKAVEIK